MRDLGAQVGFKDKQKKIGNFLMRLRRLNLLRYGHFTNFFLNFGERPITGLDFHIIFGENEAGKSTVFNGYLDLLFGIEKNSKYNFRHAYNLLQIDSVLEVNNALVEVTRIKRDKGGLIGANGQPIDDGFLVPNFYGLSRDSYQKMFSLNDDTIEQGGEEILASKGDLGRLLFSGTSALTDFSKELEILRERANKLYDEQSRSKYEIASLKQELQQLENERKNLDTLSSTYERLIADYQAKEKSCQEAQQKRKHLESEKFNLRMTRDAYVIWNELKKLENELADISYLPEIPESWIEEIKELRKNMTIGITNKNHAQSNIDDSQREIEKLANDPVIIEAKEKIAGIAVMKGRVQTAYECLPKVNDNLLNINIEIEELRIRLGVDKDADLAELIISDEIIANLDEILQKEAALTGRLSSAQQEFSNALEILETAKEAIKKIDPPDEKEIILIALLDEYAENDLHDRLEQAGEALNQASRSIELAISRLSPWKGNRCDLKFYEIPSLERTKRWAGELSFLKNKLEVQETQRAHHEQNLAKYKNRTKTLSAQLGHITDACAVSARKARDDAWIAHKQQRDNETALFFEQALFNDDFIRDGRLVNIERLTQLRKEEESLEETDNILKVISNEIQRIKNDLQSIQNEIKCILVNIGLPENFQIEDLSEWLKSIQQVNNLIEIEGECFNKRNHIKVAYDQQRDRLLEVLTNIVPISLEALSLREIRAIAKRCRNEANDNRSKYTVAKNDVIQAKKNTKEREEVLFAIRKEFDAWESNWREILKGLWLETKNVSQIRILLNLLRKLASLMTSQKKLQGEITSKKKDIDEFQTNVCCLVDSLGDKRQEDLIAQFVHLQNRLEIAQKIETAREMTKKNQEKAEVQLRKASDEIAFIENRIKEMAAFFNKPENSITLDELSIFVDQAKEKRLLLKAVSEKENTLLHCLRIKTRDDAENKFKETTLSDLETRLAMIDEELEAADQELKQRIKESRDAEREIDAIGGDARVAFLTEKRESILIEISAKANQALALHLGLMAADRALAIYRDRHSSELLTQTGDAFKIITGGVFSRLTTHPSRLGEKLIAEKASGDTIAVEAMSKGTRYQLYLALRLAAYRRFCKTYDSLPFIGDDIMETFDDHRAESTIRQLCEISKNGQVIYFTHHRHLCDIAKKVCGEHVTIHEIPKHAI